MNIDEKNLLLGIDIGTTGAKCAIYNLTGEIVAHAYREYAMLHPQENWTEQAPACWWEAVKNNLHDCFFQQGVASCRIAAIGVSCTNALTLVDAAGNPVRNAIGHHDQRADAQVTWLKENVGESLVFQITANRLDKGTFCLPALRWVIEHEPDVINRAHQLLMPSGFIIHRLTGLFSINRPRMSLTSLCDIRTGEWSTELAEKAGIPTRLLPKPYDTTEIVGGVTAWAAEETGLHAGIPVSAGCLDTVAAAVGAGAIDPGDTVLTIGSSGRVCSISSEPLYDKRLLNCISPFAGRYTVVQSTDNAGISLRWFRDVFGAAAQVQAQEQGLSIYAYLDNLAAQALPCAGGLIYLPYLAGEKAPVWNTKARGVFFGMGLGTSYGDFVRAIMEGVAFSLRDCINLMPCAAQTDQPIPMGGGAANSTVWCQIFADVLGRPILKLKSNETETLGDIIIAAQSIGLREIPRSFGKTLAENGTLLHPNPAHTARYDEHFSKYKRLYESIQTLF